MLRVSTIACAPLLGSQGYPYTNYAQGQYHCLCTALRVSRLPLHYAQGQYHCLCTALRVWRLPLHLHYAQGQYLYHCTILRVWRLAIHLHYSYPCTYTLPGVY